MCNRIFRSHSPFFPIHRQGSIRTEDTAYWPTLYIRHVCPTFGSVSCRPRPRLPISWGRLVRTGQRQSMEFVSGGDEPCCGRQASWRVFNLSPGLHVPVPPLICLWPSHGLTLLRPQALTAMVSLVNFALGDQDPLGTKQMKCIEIVNIRFDPMLSPGRPNHSC